MIRTNTITTKIKIIQFNSYSGIGGGEQILFDITKGLKNDFDFLVVAPSGLLLQRCCDIGIRTKIIEATGLLGRLKEIKKIFKKANSDIIHMHGTRAAFWGRLAIIGLKNKPKIIYTLHGFHIIRKKFFLKWSLILAERFLNRWTTFLVCVSEADKNLVLRYKTIFSKKLRLIKNGIDIERFQLTPEAIRQAREDMGLRNKLVLCSIGRLHLPKDFSTILRALKIIILKKKDVALLIIGDGPLRKSLEKEVGELGLEEFVKFLGFRKDIPLLINLSDIMILSTRWEGLPLAPIEAGACRKSIIASDIDGVREIILDKKTGFLFEPGSENDLADKILELGKSEELRKKMGQRAFEFISKNFSKQRMIKEYKSLYESLL